MLPLAGIRVLDFSTLLPGPMAGLFLVEAGAEVIKIERPGTGDEMGKPGHIGKTMPRKPDPPMNPAAEFDSP